MEIENQTIISKWKRARNDNGCEIFMEDLVTNKQAIQEQYENHENLQIEININPKMQEIKTFF